MSNIDEEEVNKDIEFIKELIEKDKIDIKGISYGKQYRILRTIKNILAEREQKDKRIKELEEALLKVKDKNIKLFINSKNSIPKQKVKDLKESIILEPTIVGGRRNAKTLEYGIKLGKIKACEELLEDK